MSIAGPPLLETFTLSLVVPFIASVFCLIMDRSLSNKILAISSLAIGATIGYINVQILDKYYFIYEGYEEKILFLTFMISIIFVLSFVIGFMYIQHRKSKDQDYRSFSRLLVVTLSLILIFSVVASSSYKITPIGFDYGYSVHVNTTSNSSYYMLVPAPLQRGGIISEIVPQLEFSSGNGIFVIEETQYGLALNISAVGSFMLNYSGHSDNSMISRISLHNNTEWDRYQIFYNSQISTNATVEVHSYDSGVGTDMGFRIDEVWIENGWNSVEGDEWISCV